MGVRSPQSLARTEPKRWCEALFRHCVDDEPVRYSRRRRENIYAAMQFWSMVGEQTQYGIRFLGSADIDCISVRGRSVAHEFSQFINLPNAPHVLGWIRDHGEHITRDALSRTHTCTPAAGAYPRSGRRMPHLSGHSELLPSHFAPMRTLLPSYMSRGVDV